MTDHLPECFNTAHMTAIDAPCICDRLRACEQRMYEWSKSFGVGKTFYDAGRAEGLDAAREAVLTYADETHKHFGDLFGQCREEYGDRCDITAALRVAAQKIDALREEQK